ncbi:MAG: glycosyltransferase family 4 protein [Acidobacteriota bacterium]
MKPFSLCIVSPHAAPALRSRYGLGSDGYFGGAEVQATLLGAGLAARGHRVTFVCRGEGTTPGRETIGPIDVLLIPPPALAPGRLAPAQNLMAALARADADLYYQRCALPLTGLVAWHCRRRHKPFIFAVANDRDLDGRAKAILGRFRFAIYRYGLRTARQIVVQTKQQMELLSTVRQQRAAHIPSAFDLRNVHPRPAPPDPVVLWVASLLPKKRPFLFLELARRLPEFPFLAVAQPATDGPLTRRFQEEADRLQNVECAGRVPHHEMGGLYARATLLLNTSEAEGVPNTFLEAWAREIPVVSTGIDPDGVIQRLNLGRVAPEQDLALSVKRFLLDPAALQAAGRAGRRYVLENHGLESFLDRWEDLLARESRRA